MLYTIKELYHIEIYPGVFRMHFCLFLSKIFPLKSLGCLDKGPDRFGTLLLLLLLSYCKTQNIFRI